MPKLRLKSVLVGVLVDKLAAVLTIGTLMAVLIESSAVFQIAALVVGSLCTALGAFVGARHAKGNHLAHGFTIGLVAFALSFVRFALTPATHSLSWELAAWSLAVVAGVGGGCLSAHKPKPAAV